MKYIAWSFIVARKASLSTTLLLIAFTCLAQIAPELPGYKGNIQYAQQKQYGNVGSNIVRPDGSQMAAGSRSQYTGLLTTIIFNANGTIASKRIELRKNVLQFEKYKYDTLDRKAFITITNTGNGTPAARKVLKKEILLSDEGRPLSYTYLFDPSSMDSMSYYPSDYNAVYENGRLLSYMHTESNAKGDTVLKSIVELTYDDRDLLASVTENSKGIVSYIVTNPTTKKRALQTERGDFTQALKRWTYQYDPEGRLISQTTELLADYYTAEEKAAITTLSYDYDKDDNWTVMHRQIGNGQQEIAATQKLDYRN